MDVLAALKTHDLEELRPIKELKCISYAIWNLESYYGYLPDSLSMSTAQYPRITNRE